MKMLISFSFILLTTCCSCSYYPDITGKVVDNETGQPIEGAVVVAQRTKPRGMSGLLPHELHRIIETLTDKDGMFFLSGTSGFLLERPIMIIYKDKYVPWRNDAVFPSSDIVKNQAWKNNQTYELGVIGNNTIDAVFDFMDYGMTIGAGRKESQIFTSILNDLSKKKTQYLNNMRNGDRQP